jgi:streptomycin 6-kinase
MMIPQPFAQAMVELYGDDGRAWLNRLPHLLADCAQRWSLQIGPPFTPLSYNYVAPAVRADGREVVIKAGVINPELLCEAAALRQYGGRGVARLLDADEAQGVMLLERLRPGTMLAALPDDDEATRVAAALMRQLWRPVPPDHPFPTVAQWAQGLSRLRRHFSGGSGPFPEALVATAEALFTELLAATTEPRLLHGDLHHNNILAAERQPWLAIDPKGVVGDRGYEVGALLRNRLPQPFNRATAGPILARRRALLAEMLALAPEAITGWGVAHCVLSAWWRYEDHGHGWEEALGCAELLAKIGR